jgi:hypothetical protein
MVILSMSNQNIEKSLPIMTKQECDDLAEQCKSMTEQDWKDLKRKTIESVLNSNS